MFIGSSNSSGSIDDDLNLGSDNLHSSSSSTDSSFLDNSPLKSLTPAQARDPEIKVRVGITTCLGYKWQKANSLNFQGWAPLVPMYAIGMVTFTIALPVRIIRVIGRAFLLLIALFSALHQRDIESLENLKRRSILLGVSSLKLVVIPLAILCPPLGYYLENKINDHLLPETETVWYYVEYFEVTMEQALQDLELEEGATMDEVTKQYKKLCLKYHSDKNPDDEEAAQKFLKLKPAYDRLQEAKELPKLSLKKIFLGHKAPLLG